MVQADRCVYDGPMPGPTRHRTLATLLTAVLWVWAATIGLSHQIGRRHALCPEHGEVVEVDGGDGGAHDAPGMYGATSVGHQHDPLAHAVLLAVQVLSSRSVCGPEPTFQDPTAMVSRPADLEILDFAPKLSPPRVG